MLLGLEFLIEVKNGVTVPSTWSKINATQKLGRYRTPYIQTILPKIQYLKEKLQLEAKKAWIQYLNNAIPRLRTLLNITKCWATLDVFVALAILAQRDGFCRPKFDMNELKVLESRNIVIEENLLTKPGCQFVPNDIDLKPQQVYIFVTIIIKIVKKSFSN